MANLPKFDKSKFTNTGYVKRIEKPWGYELHWAEANKPYMGKIMHINTECRQSLQIHDQKQETYMILNGRAKVLWENNRGEMIETELEPGKGFSTCVGQKHRLCSITDCDILEVSTPEIGTTYRLEDDYKRPDETEERRKEERTSL